DDLTALSDLMTDRGIRYVPVVDEEENLVGVVSLEALLRAGGVHEESSLGPVERACLEGRKVSEIMMLPETVVPETSLTEAAGLLLENPCGCLPVVDGTHVVGILTESDFIRIMRSATA
ncbi:MAG: CBS domain-containing protein, partial [Thermoanaerobaculia bacterium]|nr:CBS domain-containing protein [Thermoanaerobaculia bacterium]